MSPSRELDILIAEKVMGWSSRVCNEIHLGPMIQITGYEKEDGTWVDLPTPKPCQDILWFDSSGNMKDYIPCFSTSIEGAWLVVEKANIESLIRLEDGRWIAKIPGFYASEDDGSNKIAWPRLNEYYETSLYERSVIIGETASHAICLAALAALSK